MGPRKREQVKITKKSKLKVLKEKYDDFCEALALAEGGALEDAHQLIRTRKPRRILVLGAKEGFSKAVVDYALEFAERMSYEIVALSLESPLHSPPKPLVKLDQFLNEAISKNISVTHVIKGGKFEDCFKLVEKEVGPLELIISDPVFCTEVDCTEIGNFLPLITVATECS